MRTALAIAILLAGGLASAAGSTPAPASGSTATGTSPASPGAATSTHPATANAGAPRSRNSDATTRQDKPVKAAAKQAAKKKPH
jgi:hypothetical protein